MDLQSTLSQRQQTIFSAQQQQGLQLLELPLMGLQQFVAQQLTLNPLLEEKLLPQEKAVDPWEMEAQETLSFESTGTITSPADPQATARHHQFLESFSSEQNLAMVLEQQCAGWQAQEKQIATLIIGSLDAWGYFRYTIEEFAQEEHLKTAEVAHVLTQLQQLDPPGIAARDLKESLLLQLERLGKADSLAAELVQEELASLAQHRYQAVAKKRGYSLAQVLEAAKLIAHLEPYPGRAYQSRSQEREIIVDMIVWWEAEQLMVRLNKEMLPSLKINQEYKQLLAKTPPEDTLSLYLKGKIQEGRGFIHHLEQRQKTLQLLGEFLIEYQRGFFERGAEALKPLTLAQAATNLELHLSTIGRAVANKYMLCPQGILPLNYFFSHALQGESSTKIKEYLRSYLEKEDPHTPWSDQELREKLQQEGFEVARRTVTQYRQQLGFLPKHLRKGYSGSGAK